MATYMNEQTIWNFLMKEIGNPYGVAGLMGNLYSESKFNPENLQDSGNKAYGLKDSDFTDAVDDKVISKTKFCRDGFGYGLAQWTYKTRKEKLYKYCKDRNLSIGNIDGQLGFLVEELKTSYAKVWKALREAESIREASDIVLTQYEKPANQSNSVRGIRAKNGQNFYDRNMPSMDIVAVEGAPKKMVKVNVKSCCIRKGPSTAYETIGHAYKDQVFPYISRFEEGKGWYQIEFDGGKCWITDKYTSVVEE